MVDDADFDAYISAAVRGEMSPQARAFAEMVARNICPECLRKLAKWADDMVKTPADEFPQ